MFPDWYEKKEIKKFVFLLKVWSTQPPTEISTRNFLGGKGCPASVSQLSRKCGSLDVS
jgi:hypothetical protein